MSISRSEPSRAAWTLAVLLLLPAWRATAAPGPSPDVIPRPLEVASSPGVFVVSATLTIIVPPTDPQARASALSLRDLLGSG
ncbi:MAG: hypothetical protein WA825_08000, partial [Steroidobacteraceae bacterium]